MNRRFANFYVVAAAMAFLALVCVGANAATTEDGRRFCAGRWQGAREAPSAGRAHAAHRGRTSGFVGNLVFGSSGKGRRDSRGFLRNL